MKSRKQPIYVTRAIGSILPKVTKTAFRRQGFADVDIVADWPSIIGKKWGVLTFPEKLRFGKNKQPGTLYLRADSSGTAMLIKHVELELIERVNTYFGYKAVKNLKISQGMLVQQSPIKQAKALPKQELDSNTKQAISDIKNESLREALNKLGASVQMLVFMLPGFI